jgi:predicted DNA helicase
MVSILSTLRQHRLSLTAKEITIMDKLVARRDLWTDEQYLALCTQMRPLGSDAVRGNLGMGLLDDLPGGASRTGRGASSLVDLTLGLATVNGSAARKGGDAKSSRPQPAKRKKRPHVRGAADSLTDSSNDDERNAGAQKTKKKLAPKQQPGGLMSILADMGCGSAPTGTQSQSGCSISAMMKVGGNVVHAGGAAAPKDWQLDALGKRTRRQERTADELVEDFLSHILRWDLRKRGREGPPCLSVPASFESLDQYEDILMGLLLEETWEQIQTSFQEERAEIEDANADFGAMRVISFNEIGEFAFAAVCPEYNANSDSGSASAGAGAWGSGLNELDLVLLVSPDAFADVHDDRPGAGQTPRRGQRQKAQTKMEHALALVEKGERGDTERGVVRLKVLLRQTPRNKRFSERLGRLSAHHSGSRAHLDSKAPVLPGLDNDALPKLRMVCLNYNIATAQREYVAMHRLRALKPSTQRAVLDPRLSLQDACPPKGNLAVVSRHTLNEDQYSAISKCLEPGSFFALIQGPPGTGKTSTLLGLIASLLAGPSGHVQTGARVLICAPSNAAVDELAGRCYQGLWLHGRTERYRPSVVRIGAKRQMRPDVWDAVGLEQQVQHRLTHLQGEHQSAKEELDQLKKEVESLTERIEKCEPDAQKEDSAGQSMGSLLSARKHALALCAQKAALAGVSESRKDVLKRQLRSQLLENAQIVCATLSGAGTSLLQSSTRTFDAVIVDEAAQALEPSALIPLQLNVDRCILVGDPQQLPATVTSRKADENLFARSLFERLQASGHAASLLTVQYRMHPSIRAFPSQHFYDGKLKDCVSEDRHAPWHADCRFAPFVFYDIRGDDDPDVRQDLRPGGTSRSNSVEAKACVALLEALTRLMHREGGHMQKRIAVMSPYRRQCSDIRYRLSASGLQDVEVSSVDAFQGREMDVSVLSCVRSGRGGLGFVADVRRLNVALTRAKCSLLILGDADTLSQNEHWAALITHARSAGCCVRLCETQLDRIFRGDDAQWRRDSWPEHWLSVRD